MKIRRNYFSLLEVLISIALTSILLSTLLWFYRDVVFMGKRMDDTTKDLFQLRYVERRFSDILYNTVHHNTADRDFAFYTEKNSNGSLSLVVTYDNGVSDNKDFSNHVLGKLYLDDNKRFCLATWPSFKKTNVKDQYEIVKEVLLEDVESIEYLFYIPPLENGNVVAPQEVRPKNEITKPLPPNTWPEEWKREFNCTPALVKIKITQKGRVLPIYLAFPMSDKDLRINYGLSV